MWWCQWLWCGRQVVAALRPSSSSLVVPLQLPPHRRRRAAAVVAMPVVMQGEAFCGMQKMSIRANKQLLASIAQITDGPNGNKTYEDTDVAYITKSSRKI